VKKRRNLLFCHSQFWLTVIMPSRVYDWCDRLCLWFVGPMAYWRSPQMIMAKLPMAGGELEWMGSVGSTWMPTQAPIIFSCRDARPRQKQPAEKRGTLSSHPTSSPIPFLHPWQLAISPPVPTLPPPKKKFQAPSAPHFNLAQRWLLSVPFVAILASSLLHKPRISSPVIRRSFHFGRCLF
jgi:hypothetical protein